MVYWGSKVIKQEKAKKILFNDKFKKKRVLSTPLISWNY